MSRIARDSPGMERNVPRPGQVHSGTMKRPGMKFSGAQFADVVVIFFKNQKVKIYRPICNKTNMRMQQKSTVFLHKSVLNTSCIKLMLYTLYNIHYTMHT